MPEIVYIMYSIAKYMLNNNDRAGRNLKKQNTVIKYLGEVMTG
jgi:hypothetical protein